MKIKEQLNEVTFVEEGKSDLKDTKTEWDCMTH